MKTTSVFFILLVFVACSGRKSKIEKTLSAHHNAPAHLLFFWPTTSTASDSIDYANAYKDYNVNNDIFMRYLDTGANPDTTWIGDTLKASKVRYRAAYNRLVSSKSAPGFTLVRYLINKQPDTLTAVLDSSFRIVWPR